MALTSGSTCQRCPGISARTSAKEAAVEPAVEPLDARACRTGRDALRHKTGEEDYAVSGASEQQDGDAEVERLLGCASPRSPAAWPGPGYPSSGASGVHAAERNSDRRADGLLPRGVLCRMMASARPPTWLRFRVGGNDARGHQVPG